MPSNKISYPNRYSPTGALAQFGETRQPGTPGVEVSTAAPPHARPRSGVPFIAKVLYNTIVLQVLRTADSAC